jgi:hypothetical protein
LTGADRYRSHRRAARSRQLLAAFMRRSYRAGARRPLPAMKTGRLTARALRGRRQVLLKLDTACPCIELSSLASRLSDGMQGRARGKLPRPRVHRYAKSAKGPDDFRDPVAFATLKRRMYHRQPVLRMVCVKQYEVRPATGADSARARIRSKRISTLQGCVSI